MKKLLFVLFGIVLFGFSAFCQNAFPGKPETIHSFTIQGVDLSQKNKGENALIEIQKPNLATIVAQDAVNDSKQAYRVGVNITCNFNTSNSGTWSVSEDGVKIWKLKIHSDDAQALGLYYSDVTLPVGSKLFLYNENKAQVIGAFTSQTPDIKATEMIEGETLTIEYNEPVGVTGAPNIQISQVVYFYRGVEDRIGAYRDYQQITPKADACQVNVACSESTGWEDQVDAVVHYTFSSGGGTFVCSASLINNTSEDCTPYILTATHCGEVTTSAGLNNHVWYFNYQNPNCVPGATAQYPKPSSTATGGIFRASSKNTWNNATAGNNQVFGTDFTLVELPSGTTLPTNAFFAGWDRSATASPSGVGIHHPAGHDKKISTYTGSLSSTTYNGGITNAHWLVTWNATTNGHGVTEGGSSGSPIFNNSGLIVGMLSGGSSFCTNTGAPDLYGKIDVSWDPSGAAADGRLKDWLDPTNTGAMTQNGIQTPCSPQLPVADFVSSNTNPLEGATILLSDLTTGVPTSWAWTISGTQGTDWVYANSTTVASQNPEVTFNVAGTYDVTLTATNAQGNDTETKTGYIIVTALVCEDPTNTPYIADIQNTDFSQWRIINDNGDTDANNPIGGLWNLLNLGFGQANTDSLALLYLYNSDGTTAADDWFFTGCIDLVAGNTYDLSFYHRVGGEIYPEDLEMFIGTDQTIAAMTNSVIDLDGLTNTVWTKATGTFTPTTTETYYLGFHCTSAANMWYVAVDDINISFTPSSVLSVTNSPSSSTTDNIIVLYPNPTNGMFTVELPENNTSVDILDMNGKIIFTQKNIASNKANFSLEGLAKGIYQVKITLENKVVVKRVSKM